MYTYSFEKLEVWKRARIFVGWIYKLTQFYPPTEKYCLVLQLRKAAVSIVSNIAEGSGRRTSKDKVSFIQNAYSSVIEILNQLIVSRDLEYIDDLKLKEGRNEIEYLTEKLSALRKSITKANYK